jgi:uncharacterized protein (DUF433 family)
MDRRLWGAGLGDHGAIHAAETAEAIVEQTAEEYQLPADAVRAAIAYYQRHVDVINARIVTNVAI